VVEYPSGKEFMDTPLERQIENSEALKRAIEQIAEYEFKNPIDLYWSWLSAAPGTKVGGYPHWIQYPETPQCQCALPMEHLLTIASGEFDGRDWGRWLPKRDRRLINTPGERGYCPTGLMLGDVGDLYVFICRNCDGWPLSSVFQCC
jgi:hypothetical protein